MLQIYMSRLGDHWEVGNLMVKCYLFRSFIKLIGFIEMKKRKKNKLSAGLWVPQNPFFVYGLLALYILLDFFINVKGVAMTRGFAG